MKKFLTVFTVLALLIVPAVSLAASYHYVSLEGEVKTIEANTATEALALAHQNGAAPTSGVKVDTGILDAGDTIGDTYQYVSATGEVKSVTAASVEAAFMLATDIAPDSGLLIANIE